MASQSPAGKRKNNSLARRRREKEEERGILRVLPRDFVPYVR